MVSGINYKVYRKEGKTVESRVGLRSFFNAIFIVFSLDNGSMSAEVVPGTVMLYFRKPLDRTFAANTMVVVRYRVCKPIPFRKKAITLF